MYLRVVSLHIPWGHTIFACQQPWYGGWCHPGLNPHGVCMKSSVLFTHTDHNSLCQRDANVHVFINCDSNKSMLTNTIN